MPGSEPKKRVKMNDLGEGSGQTVAIAESQLEDAGVDPNAELEANRQVLDTQRNAGEIRLRIYEVDDE